MENRQQAEHRAPRRTGALSVLRGSWMLWRIESRSTAQPPRDLGLDSRTPTGQEGQEELCGPGGPEGKPRSLRGCGGRQAPAPPVEQHGTAGTPGPAIGTVSKNVPVPTGGVPSVVHAALGTPAPVRPLPCHHAERAVWVTATGLLGPEHPGPATRAPLRWMPTIPDPPDPNPRTDTQPCLRREADVMSRAPQSHGPAPSPRLFLPLPDQGMQGCACPFPEAKPHRMWGGYPVAQASRASLLLSRCHRCPLLEWPCPSSLMQAEDLGSLSEGAPSLPQEEAPRFSLWPEHAQKQLPSPSPSPDVRIRKEVPAPARLPGASAAMSFAIILFPSENNST